MYRRPSIPIFSVFPVSSMFLARFGKLVLLTVLALMLALPSAAECAPKRFGSDQEKNVALFLDEDGWDEAMAEACRMFMKDGLLASCILAQQYAKNLKDEKLAQIRVEDMKKAFALASFIFNDRVYAEKALPSAQGAEKERLDAILQFHESTAKAMVDPATIHALASERLGLSKEQEDELLMRMDALFVKTFRAAMAADAKKTGNRAATDGQAAPDNLDLEDEPID